MRQFLEEVDAAIGNEVKIVKVDVDTSQVTAEHYQIMSIPSLLVFEDGELKGKTAGFKRRFNRFYSLILMDKEVIYSKCVWLF